jgi:hypothetical protein
MKEKKDGLDKYIFNAELIDSPISRMRRIAQKLATEGMKQFSVLREGERNQTCTFPTAR